MLFTVEWKLYEAMKLESGTTRIYKHDADAMRIPRLSNQPPTLQAIPILNNEDDAKGSLSLKVSLEKPCRHPCLNGWTPEKWSFKLVYYAYRSWFVFVICFPNSAHFKNFILSNYVLLF
ncbi:uncharacterized protein LOC120164681 [Hibiscus syriacus]|uniref:uncharacterized protein LOC120164681 n=1 Tax=Hibiscus syriacus TaxID=106335 RepID=UPI001922B4D0|nr:uncharacterized protein LOC120164681 [Hibiscus syriacus]